MAEYKMTKRKIALLGACAVLLCVYVVQLVVSFQNPVKERVLKASLDEILISNAGEDVRLVKKNEEWFVGEQMYPASSYTVDSILQAIETVRVLGTVDKAGNEQIDSRYELDSSHRMIVRAFENGEIKRALTIGKASTAGSQSYILLDSEKDIYLASGRLRDTFGKTVADIRSNSVYSIESASIDSVHLNVGQKNFSVKKEGDPAIWKAENENLSLDSEKISAWVNSLASLSVNAWLAEDVVLPSGAGMNGAFSTTTIVAGEKTIVVSLYKNGEEENSTYYATCSESPYKFELNQYAATKFFKNVVELQ